MRLDRPVIGILHPGAMGAALGSALKPAAAQVIWAAAGRSDTTAKRAEIADLVAVPDVPELVQRSDVVISICPPDAAVDVASQVAAAGAPTWYVDANAIAPSTMREIAELLDSSSVVDAAVIGPPAWQPRDTVLWLSGTGASQVAQLFAGSPFEARIVDSQIGSASAVKACFALYSKAMPAAWQTLAEAAEHYGVFPEVREELARDGVDVDEQLASFHRRAETKAWRWAGEMVEVAAALDAAGTPNGSALAAADVYRRIAAAKSERENAASA